MPKAPTTFPVLDEIIVVTGRVDVSTVAGLREALHAAVERSGGRVVIDVSGVEAIDATGLGMLVGTQSRAQSRGKELVLRDVPDRMGRLLTVTHLGRVLPSEATAPAGAA